MFSKLRTFSFFFVFPVNFKSIVNIYNHLTKLRKLTVIDMLGEIRVLVYDILSV